MKISLDTVQRKVKLENDSLVMFERGFNLSNIMCFQLKCTLVGGKKEKQTRAPTVRGIRLGEC